MECKDIPPAPFWADAPRERVEQYRTHMQDCDVCRTRTFFEAPDVLLFELRSRGMPEDFWTGFWPSLRSRRTDDSSRISTGRSVLRWVAVLALSTILSLHVGTYRKADESSAPAWSASPSVSVSSRYPLLERVQNPGAKYLILRHTENETIIWVFDPDIEL